LGNLLKLPNALFIYFLKEEEPCFFFTGKEEEPCWASQCQAAVWLARLLAEITGGEVNKPILRVDNKFTVSLI
jgi:hypothetical protein